MQKNEKKTKTKAKTKTSSSPKTRRTKSPASRRNNGLAFILIAIAVLIILASYAFLGLKLTIVVALLLFILYGIGFLLGRVKSKSRRKKIITLLLIFCLIIGIIGLCGFSVFMIYVKTQADPKYEEAKLNTIEVSRMFDKDGNEFAKIGEENREKVKYEQLPEVLVDAIIATEDSRFYQHNGFDAPRFLKASIGQVAGDRGAGGASTLTMQVVKNSFTDKYGEKTHGIEGITRKFEDIYLAVFKLEKEYSKEEIIEFYVNNHFLGGTTYGVQEASMAYFGKSVTDLNLSEAAIIAGMFKSPNAYRPTTNPEAAAARRKTVLGLMRRHGYITKEEEAIANAIPIETLTASARFESDNVYQGYIDYVVDELKDRFNVNPYTTPMLVYTNLDRTRQNGVNAVLNGETYDWKDDLVQSGVAVLDSETGKVWAIGNGRNTHSRTNGTIDQFNFATDIRRQPGSTAKPLFDYGPGMEFNNWSTYQIFDDAPYSYSNGRSIKNWDGGYFGTITLRTALSQSRNIPALKAFQQVDDTKRRKFVTGLGIEPEICADGYDYDYDSDKCVNAKNATDTHEPYTIHEAHSIGAFTGVSPLQMAAAYAAFSNGGYYNEPHAVNKFVYRQTGEEVEYKTKRRQVMSDSTAFMISSVLQDVSLSGGTPKNVAAKTGTTNYDDVTMDNYDMPWDAVRDSWVVGYSTKTVIGMWYGYDSLTKEQIQQGYILHNIPATIAKDILFNAYVSSGAMESNREPFKQPSSVVQIAVAPGSNPAKLAIPGTDAIYEYFKKGYEPTEYYIGNYKLPAPANFKATSSGSRVTLSWSAVNPGSIGNSSYGKFGYNIYKDGVLVDWTDKTTYTYSPTDGVYGTYKVIATYKNSSEVQSYEATATIEEEVPKPSCPPEAPLDSTKNECVCTDPSKKYDSRTKTCR